MGPTITASLGRRPVGQGLGSAPGRYERGGRDAGQRQHGGRTTARCGGLLALPVAVRIVRPGRVAAVFAVGLAPWGLPVAAAAVADGTVAAIVLLGAVGLGNAFVDVAAHTLVQRLAQPANRPSPGRSHALLYAGAGFGALAAERLMDGTGLTTSLLVLGLFGHSRLSTRNSVASATEASSLEWCASPCPAGSAGHHDRERDHGHIHLRSAAGAPAHAGWELLRR